MKRKGRIIVSLLVSIMMVLQLCSVTFAATSVDISKLTLPEKMDTPEVVAKSDSYMEIPVYYEEGNDNSTTPVSAVTVYLKKEGGTDKSEGYATFKVQGYAYKSGTTVKLGILYGYFSPEGVWTEHFLDQAGVKDLGNKYTNETWKNIDYWTRVTGFKFTPGQEQHSGTRVRFLTDTSFNSGVFHDRDSNNVLLTPVPFVDPLQVTRKVTEVADEMNVWQVDLTVKNIGAKTTSNESADIILVLDRSGSMKEKCDNNKTRAQLVEKAGQEMVAELAARTNTRVAVVSFGGGYTNYWNKTYEHFDNNWNSIQAKTINGWYTDYKVNADFTSDAKTLSNAVSNAMNDLGSGTPMSLGLIKAGLMMQESTATNKYIILLSDGAPTYTRTGEEPKWMSQSHINQDMKNAASELKSKVDGVKLFTIAAGKSITDEGKKLLKECATSEKHYYIAADSAAALKDVMQSIIQNIPEPATNTSLQEAINGEFELVLPKDVTTGVVTKPASELASVDWDQTNAVISQGSLNTLSDGKVNWQIGKLAPGTTATLSYRIEMTSGKLANKYDVYSSSQVKYLNAEGTEKAIDVDNTKLRASWAIVDAGNYDNKGNLLPGTSTVKACFKVDTATYSDGDISISRQTLVGSDQKVVTSGGQMLDSLLPITEPYQLVGVKSSDGKVISSSDPKTAKVNITDVKSDVEFVTVIPEMGTIEDSEHNYIQPEGVTNVTATVKFTAQQSKDVVFKADLNALESKTLGDQVVMNYDNNEMSKISLEVKDSNGKVYKNTDYTATIAGNVLTLTFDSGIVFDKDTVLTVGLYFKSSLNSGIDYANVPGSYVKEFTDKDVKATVATTTTVTPKLIDTTEEDGTVVECWGSPVTATKDITVKYVEMASIK